MEGTGELAALAGKLQAESNSANTTNVFLATIRFPPHGPEAAGRSKISNRQVNLGAASIPSPSQHSTIPSVHSGCRRFHQIQVSS
jgi:hypothetical protein